MQAGKFIEVQAGSAGASGPARALHAGGSGFHPLRTGVNQGCSIYYLRRGILESRASRHFFLIPSGFPAFFVSRGGQSGLVQVSRGCLGRAARSGLRLSDRAGRDAPCSGLLKPNELPAPTGADDRPESGAKGRGARRSKAGKGTGRILDARRNWGSGLWTPQQPGPPAQSQLRGRRPQRGLPTGSGKRRRVAPPNRKRRMSLTQEERLQPRAYAKKRFRQEDSARRPRRAGSKQTRPQAGFPDLIGCLQSAPLSIGQHCPASAVTDTIQNQSSLIPTLALFQHVSDL